MVVIRGDTRCLDNGSCSFYSDAARAFQNPQAHEASIRV